MEYEEPLAEQNQNLPEKSQTTGETVPTEAPPPVQPAREQRSKVNRRGRKRGFINQLGLVISGLCCYAFLIVLASFIWGYLVYSRKGYIGGEGLLPAYIFLGAIFVSACLITALSRGGAIFPVLLFTIAANAASLMPSELSLPSLGSLLTKLGLSLLPAATGFILTKLLVMRLR